MTNVGKKVSLFLVLNFCFAKSHLRVCDHIWEKSGRKVNHIVRKTWNLFLSKTTTLSRKLATKKWGPKWGIFFVIHSKSPQMCWHLKNLSLQQNLKMMSKIKENDGYWCFTRILNFGSKTFRMLEFTLSTYLLFAHCQHLEFWTNAFSESDPKKMLHVFFMLPQNFGTKFKIHKKVLNICWIARVFLWRKVFFTSETC